jgi:hypothetical protein
MMAGPVRPIAGANGRGVRYSFAVSLFADLDGSYFIANIASFEPIEWRAGIRVAG